MAKTIKRRLLDLDKYARDLLVELHSRYHETLDEAQLSKIIKGNYRYGMAKRVLEEIDTVLNDWEAKK